MIRVSRRAGQGKQSRQKGPEDNPWYLLATLYGVPANLQDERRDRNRCAWNRYFVSQLDEETRAQLVKESRYCEAELTPFSEEELCDIRSAFAERKGSKGHVELPSRSIPIDFSNVQFDERPISHIIYL
jgi:hypothetical protein